MASNYTPFSSRLAALLPSSVVSALAASSRYVRLALLLAVLQTILFVSLEAVILQQHRTQAALLSVHRTEVAIALFVNQSPLQADMVIRRTSALTFYYVLFIVSLFFQFVLCIDAVVQKNSIQIVGLMLFHIMTLGYTVIQIVQAQGLIAPAIAANIQTMVPDFHGQAATFTVGVSIAVLMLLFVLAWFYLNWKLLREFGWQIFKQIGADLRMRRMYLVYQVFITILKFDVFMLLAFSTQWLIMLVDEAQQEGSPSYGDYSQVWIHSVVSCGGSVVMLIVAYWAIRTERKWAMILFILADLATVAYFISKIVSMQPPHVTIGVQCIPGWPPESCDRYDGSRNFFTLFLTVDIILGLTTAAIAVRALMNFNRGLLPHVSLTKRSRKRARDNAAAAANGVGFNDLGTSGSLEMSSQLGQKRWTID